MPIVSYHGHVLVVDGWEKACAEENEPILRKMVTLEEFTDEENAYMEQCHQEYDARREQADVAFKNACWTIAGAATLAVVIALVLHGIGWAKEYKKIK